MSWLEIDLAALAANVRAFQGRLGGAKLAAVVKSEAYGHGVALVAPAALRAGASWLAVWGANEGIPLRALVGPDVPILCLGHTPPQDFADAVAADLRLTLYDPSAIPALARAARAQGRTARVHLKLETGTHRQGLEAEDAVALARAVAAEPEVLLEGISTHYADIEDTTDHGYAESQMARFTEGVDRVAAAGPRPTVRHTACSAAAILFPRTHFDMARVGIGLYGLWPSRETLVSARERGLSGFALSPVMTWKALLAQVKDVPAGGYVGYGRTWRAQRRTRIAVIPVGLLRGLLPGALLAGPRPGARPAGAGAGARLHEHVHGGRDRRPRGRGRRRGGAAGARRRGDRVGRGAGRLGRHHPLRDHHAGEPAPAARSPVAP